LSRLEALKPEMSRRGFPGFFQHWDVGFWLWMPCICIVHSLNRNSHVQ
jgi:hypothetical protein